jgi:uncharacterized protein (DUF2147 family)
MRFSTIFLSAFALATSLMAFVAAPTLYKTTEEPNAITGLWLTASKRGRVQIVQQGNVFTGRLVWMKDEGKPINTILDDKNEKPELRSRTLLNLPLLDGFQFNGRDEWNGGKIYNPEDGKTYSCKLTLKDPNTLNVRGFVGISLFGKTEIWTRAK